MTLQPDGRPGIVIPAKTEIRILSSFTDARSLLLRENVAQD